MQWYQRYCTLCNIPWCRPPRMFDTWYAAAQLAGMAEVGSLVGVVPSDGQWSAQRTVHSNTPHHTGHRNTPYQTIPTKPHDTARRIPKPTRAEHISAVPLDPDWCHQCTPATQPHSRPHQIIEMKRITLCLTDCSKMISHLKSINSRDRRDAGLDGGDGSRNCKIDV